MGRAHEDGTKLLHLLNRNVTRQENGGGGVFVVKKNQTRGWWGRNLDVGVLPALEERSGVGKQAHRSPGTSK